MSAYGGLDCMPIVTVYRTVISCGTYSLEEAFEFCCHSLRRTRVKEASTRTNLYNNNNNNNNKNNIFLIRCKLTSEYVHMRLTTLTTCNNYNNVYLRILKFII